MARWDEPAGHFLSASQGSVQCKSCGNNWPPNKPGTRPGFLLTQRPWALPRVLVLLPGFWPGFGRCWFCPDLGLLTWLLARILTLLALSRILVLLARLLAGVLALLAAALVALLILLVLFGFCSSAID